jgi:hypothetical protein
MKNKAYNLSLIVFLIFGGTIMFVVSTKNDHKEKNALRNEYPIMLRADNVSGKVSSAYCFKGVTMLTLNNDEKFAIYNSRNYNYKSFALCSFLISGDSINKPSGSDTLFIYNENKEFYFVLGKDIGEKYNKRFYSTPPPRE